MVLPVNLLPPNFCIFVDRFWQSCPFVELSRIDFRLGPPWAHVWERSGQIPALESFLVDEVAMIGANEPFCNPTLLEQRLLGASKVGFFCKLAERPPPEVVEVLLRPALRTGARQRSCAMRR